MRRSSFSRASSRRIAVALASVLGLTSAGVTTAAPPDAAAPSGTSEAGTSDSGTSEAGSDPCAPDLAGADDAGHDDAGHDDAGHDDAGHDDMDPGAPDPDDAVDLDDLVDLVDGPDPAGTEPDAADPADAGSEAATTDDGLGCVIPDDLDGGPAGDPAPDGAEQEPGDPVDASDDAEQEPGDPVEAPHDAEHDPEPVLPIGPAPQPEPGPVGEPAPGPGTDPEAGSDADPGPDPEPEPSDGPPAPPEEPSEDALAEPGAPSPEAERLAPAEAGAGAARVVDPVDDGPDPLDPPPADLPEVVEEPPAPLPETDTRWRGGVPRADSPRGPGPSPLRPGRTPGVDRVRFVDDIEVILATIRQLESGERYDIGPNRAGASGAYQFIPSTWNGEAGYPEAYLAPPEVQDARARADVERFLAMYGGDVSMVPIMWYYPRAAVDPAWMDRVPNPAGGNVLTIREYQQRWLDLLVRNAETMLGTVVAASGEPAAASVLSDLPEPETDEDDETGEAGAAAEGVEGAEPAEDEPAAGVQPSEGVEPGDGADPDADHVPPIELDALYVAAETVELAARSVPPRPLDEHGLGSMRSIVFPVLGPATYADGWGDPRDGGARRHEGTDIIGVKMQPLLAAVDGVISHVRAESIGISGVGLSIRDADGWRYNYFHLNNDTPSTDDGEAGIEFRLAPGLSIGDEVVAGQIIGYMGDSGNAEASVPHLHFEFRDPEGRARPSYWSLQAAEARQACSVAIGPWATPNAGVPVGDDDLADDELAGDDPAVAERRDDQADDEHDDVWHTVVTPLFGEGEWIIDSQGRVTATGDAALIVPSRSLECDPGPSAPFGTDSGGWGDVRPGALDDTVWAEVDLAGTPLDGVVPPAPDEADQTAEADDDAGESSGAADEAGDQADVSHVAREETDEPSPLDDDDLRVDDDRRPLMFVDPSSGERIFVVFDPLPAEPLVSAVVYELPPGIL